VQSYSHLYQLIQNDISQENNISAGLLIIGFVQIAWHGTWIISSRRDNEKFFD
jgi:hypothetical protein